MECGQNACRKGDGWPFFLFAAFLAVAAAN
jgi:hypothetical protein